LKRAKFTLGPVLGYHGCDRQVAEGILAGQSQLKHSENDYDWLGPGIYFWIDSPERGFIWAQEQCRRPASRIKEPAVLGAFIHPGLCLNLTDFGVSDELLIAYQTLVESCQSVGIAPPRNSVMRDGILMRRHLDCAVIKTVHQLRHDAGLEAYDSVYGVFEEGEPLFPGSGFRAKTHIQMAVINPECVLGYFRVPPFNAPAAYVAS